VISYAYRHLFIFGSQLNLNNPTGTSAGRNEIEIFVLFTISHEVKI